MFAISCAPSETNWGGIFFNEKHLAVNGRMHAQPHFHLSLCRRVECGYGQARGRGYQRKNCPCMIISSATFLAQRRKCAHGPIDESMLCAYLASRPLRAFQGRVVRAMGHLDHVEAMECGSSNPVRGTSL